MHQAARSRDLGPGLGKAQLDKGGLFSILSLVGLRETSSRFAGRGVHCCAAAGKDANVSARPKAAERPVPARRFNLAMEILHCRFGGLSATLYPQAEFRCPL